MSIFPNILVVTSDGGIEDAAKAMAAAASRGEKTIICASEEIAISVSDRAVELLRKSKGNDA